MHEKSEGSVLFILIIKTVLDTRFLVNHVNERRTLGKTPKKINRLSQFIFFL